MKKHLFDVRDPEKFEADHAEGAANHPHTKILAGEFPEVAKDDEIVLYCGTGNKAGRMAEEFKAAGFSNVRSTSLDELKRST